MAYSRPLLPLLVLCVPVAACNGSLATVGDSSDAAPPVITPSDAGNSDSGSPNDGGKPVNDASTIPFTVCSNDQSCNADPNVSSLFGKCFEGICICQKGFHVQPNGKCAQTPAPDCTTQAGKCFQQPATCPDGTLEGTGEADMSCGDLIAAVCCFTNEACAGPADMICCGSSTNEPQRPICENGWRTCRPAEKPSSKKLGCP